MVRIENGPRSVKNRKIKSAYLKMDQKEPTVSGRTLIFRGMQLSTRTPICMGLGALAVLQNLALPKPDAGAKTCPATPATGDWDSESRLERYVDMSAKAAEYWAERVYPH